MAVYVNQVSRALLQHNAAEASRLLSLRDHHVQELLAHVGGPALQAAISRALDDPEASVVSAHVQVLKALTAGNMVEAFDGQTRVFGGLCAALERETGDNWRLKVIEVSLIDLRLLACKADEQLQGNDEEPHCLNDAMKLIIEKFGMFASDRGTDGPRSKRLGIMFLVNHLVAIGFRLNNFSFLNSLGRTLGQANCQFSMAHRVANAYQMGRKAFFEADFDSARERLHFALEHCHMSSPRNKRLILIYLIPANLLKGVFPSRALIHKHGLLEFEKVVETLKSGHLSAFKAELTRHQAFFIQWGIILALEKLRMLLCRNLFKQVVTIVEENPLPLNRLTTALELSKGDGSKVTIEEAECIVANLIRLKYIKGYIHHASQRLVLSKENPFPDLTL